MYKQNKLTPTTQQLQSNTFAAPGVGPKQDLQSKFANINNFMKGIEQEKGQKEPVSVGSINRPYSGYTATSTSKPTTTYAAPEQPKTTDLSSVQDSNKVLQDQIQFMKRIMEMNQKISQQQQQIDELNSNLIQKTQKVGDESKSVGVLQEQISNLKAQINQENEIHKERLNIQKSQYENEINQTEQQIQEKDNQIQETAKEFESYNLEEIQQAMEKMQSENQMRDQIIKELQDKLQNAGQGKEPSDSKDKRDNEEVDAMIEEAQQQLQQKDEEIKKLEELIENFKSLYQHMNDEKTILIEENQQLSNENGQFRELFQQNLHLFGIDPNQLNEGEEEEGDQQEDVEIVDEGEEQ